MLNLQYHTYSQLLLSHDHISTYRTQALKKFELSNEQLQKKMQDQKLKTEDPEFKYFAGQLLKPEDYAEYGSDKFQSILNVLSRTALDKDDK